MKFPIRVQSGHIERKLSFAEAMVYFIISPFKIFILTQKKLNHNSKLEEIKRLLKKKVNRQSEKKVKFFDG